MSLLQLCAVAILGATSALVLKRLGKEQHIPLLIGCICLLGLGFAARIGQTALLSEWMDRAGYGSYLPRLLKGLGICISVEIASGFCRECGAEQVGKMLEWVGKAEILLLTIPLIKELMELAGAMLT